MEEQPANDANDTIPNSIKAPGKPGWEIKLTPNKTPKTVSAMCSSDHLFRGIFTIAELKDLDIHHMDAVEAFMNPKLIEEIYMKISSFLPEYREEKFGKLVNLYMDCNKPQDTGILTFQITLNPDWGCYVHIHVNDLTIVSNNVKRFKKFIEARFEMKDLGPARYILGIEIHQNRIGKILTLLQITYVKNLLDEYQMTNCKPVSTPIVPNSRLKEAFKEERHAFKGLNINYQQAISKISYLEVATRGGNSPNLQTFSDGYYANCKDTRKSITCYMTMVGNSCINWKSKKKTMISKSSCEDEYKAQFEGGKDLFWTAILLQYLRRSVDYPLQLNGDNQGAIALANNPQINELTKHFYTIFHWIQEMTMKKNINIPYIPTQQMPVDGLTKALPQLAHERFVKS
ncbi:hypothetical protein O181_012123 [Austropuccinia psidii MF-1]|uniref:Reverse transcriptase Ty1/copia-type domain-containing protein n=1 Tax=Austropuccinia psidii MF-1 TaxID=1389203 RepID=A0A9Q3BWL8_9BASI|nr:hypothetical protein [Austropuccinia psidii MF-1]